MLRLLTPRVAVAAGSSVGLALALLAATLDTRTPAPAAPPPATPAAALAFLDAWERSRTATYVVRSTFERRLDGRTGLRRETFIAQRPPDRLVVGAGSVSGRLEGRRLACATDEDGELRCRQGAPAGSYRDAVAREVDLLEGYVLGDTRLYDVADLGQGCFELRLRLSLDAPPYGTRAELCFDAATGAPVRSVVEREGAVDVTEADDVRSRVRPADLAPPAEAE